MHTLLSFLAALTILIAVHEFGHFWVAKRLGVRVLRFSIGFGRPIWRFQRSSADTEFVLSAVPLGGYVRMVDEREGPVAPADLPYAFNRQSLVTRFAIVAAGPVANFILAVLFYWVVFAVGEPGVKPVLGDLMPGTLAYEAGFRSGDEIRAVDGESTPTWGEAMGRIVERVLDQEAISVSVRTPQGEVIERDLRVPGTLSDAPDKLYEKLGMVPWQPELEPVVDRVEPGSRAESAGMRSGDRVLSADGQPIRTWQEWVKYVRARPGVLIRADVERGDTKVPLKLTPAESDMPGGKVGRIGASVRVPPSVDDSMTVTYRLDLLPALGAAIAKTADYSMLTLKMIGRMLIGKAALENLSGPISIAQYAGASASLGLVQFLRFLAAISVSLGVLNLLPIPVLDGGHLLLYGVEAVMGRPLSEQIIARFQQVGLFILISLMSLAFYLDIERLLS